MNLNQAVDHVYAPLSQPTEIRIAIIEPAMKQDAPLRFSFRQACLDDLEGRYEAVSYVWGEPILSFPVYHVEDGSQLPVTQNLDRALRRLRHRLDPRWLWADAICIDQRNDGEKAIQIPLMIDIFRGAKKVLAWLHQGDESLERGMRFLDYLSRRLRKSIADTEDEPTEKGDDMARKLEEVAKFLDLPYFRRIWVIQEVVFSLDVTLICGKAELSWLRMSTVLTSNSWPLSWPLQAVGYNAGGIRKMSDLWRQNCVLHGSSSSHNGRGEHILELVSDFRTYGCTDPRDRIFALFSMSQDNNAHLKIDYSLDVYSTYRKFALACMSGDQRPLHVLVAALARLNVSTPVSWPSWVPDWRLEPSAYYEYWPVAHKMDVSALPRIGFTGKTCGNAIEIAVQYMYLGAKLQCPNDETLLPFTICATRVTSTDSSPVAFLSSVVKLYKKISKDFALDPYLLWELLISVWDFVPIYPNLGQLQGYIDRLWSSPNLWWDMEGADDSLFSSTIRKVTKGRCFFEAKVEDTDETFFCYGPSDVTEGDVLVAGVRYVSRTKGHNSHPAFVLRSATGLVKQHANSGTKEPYRLVGGDTSCIRVLNIFAFVR